MDLHKYILSNLETSQYTKDHIQDAVEGIADVEVVSVYFDPFISDRILIETEDTIDLPAFYNDFKEEHGWNIEQALPSKSVFVRNVDPAYLSREILKLYFEYAFADGNDVVEISLYLAEQKVAKAVFSSEEVFIKALCEKEQIPLKTENEYCIQVEPYHSNFHDEYKNIAEPVQPQTPAKPEKEVPTNHLKKEGTHSRSQSETTMRGWQEANQKLAVPLKKSKPLHVNDEGRDVTANESSEDEETDTVFSEPKSIFDAMSQINIPEIKWFVLQKTLEEQLTGCKLMYDTSKEVLNILTAPDISNVKRKAQKIISNTKEEELTISENMQTVCQRDQAKQIFDSIPDARVAVQKRSLSIIAADDSAFDKTVKLLKDTLGFESTKSQFGSLKSISVKDVPMEALRKCQERLERDFCVKISYDDDNQEFHIEGLKPDVRHAGNFLVKELPKCMIQTETFELTGAIAEYFGKGHYHLFDNVPKDVKITNRTFEKQKISVSFKGRAVAVSDFNKAIQKTINNIKTKEISLAQEFPDIVDYSLVAKKLESEMSKKHEIRIDHDIVCHVSVDFGLDDNTKLQQSATASGGSSQTTNNNELNDLSASNVPPTPKPRKQRFNFNVSPSCSLVINPHGNIVKETSDVLVCTIDGSGKLSKTSVGQAFMKIEKSLQSIVAEATFSNSGVYIANINKPNLSNIAFVQFKRWDPSSSIEKLTNAVAEILTHCEKSRLASVSFPPMGCGRAFKFPEDEVGEIVIEAVKRHMDNNTKTSLKSITLLVDETLLSATEKACAKHFKQTPNPDHNQGKKSSANSGQGQANSPQSVNKEDWVGEEVRTSVKITLVSDKELDLVWTKWKHTLQNDCLHMDTFQQDYSDCWPPEFSMNVLKRAKELSVWIRKVTLQSTPHLGYEIKGNKVSVNELKAFINSEFDSFFHLKPKKPIIGQNTPKRHTLEFVNHAAESNESCPSYWKIHGKLASENSQTDEFEDIDQKTFFAISDLLQKTWDQSKVGLGNDAQGIPKNSKLQVVRIQRNENLDLFKLYSIKRQLLFNRASKNGQLMQPIDKISKSQRPVQTEACLPNFMKDELYTEINEHYLLHGTKNDVYKKVASQGFNHNVSNSSSMFGKGVYFAECSTKSDQYTDPRNQRTGQELRMFLSRVLLGNAFSCDENHPTIAIPSRGKLCQPPCTSCGEDLCRCDVILHDSVIGDGKWIFREFVVYSECLGYPEYLITYKRI